MARENGFEKSFSLNVHDIRKKCVILHGGKYLQTITGINSLTIKSDNMLHFKQGLGWKACYDDEKNLYTAKTSWRGDFHLYEINAEIFNQLGESDVDSERLIHSGRHLYYSEDNPIGPPTDMIIDENYAELCSWTEIQESGNVMPKELTDIAVGLWENEETHEHRKEQRSGRLNDD